MCNIYELSRQSCMTEPKVCSNFCLRSAIFYILYHKALKNGQKELTAVLKLLKMRGAGEDPMIRVLIALLSVKIYILLVIYPFLTSWEALDVV